MASSVQTSSSNNVMPHLLSTLPGFEQNETANGCGSSNGNGFGQNTLNHFQNIHVGPHSPVNDLYFIIYIFFREICHSIANNAKLPSKMGKLRLPLN
jgi:hypothetical protein